MAKSVAEIIKIVEDHESKLRSLGTLVTNVELNLSKKNLQDFLMDFLYWNHMSEYENITTYKGTVKGDSEGKKLNTNIQCGRQRRRSIGDLFQIALAHFSNKVTLMEVMESMMKIVNDAVPLKTKDGKYTYYMYVSTCSTIHRKVFNASTSNRTYNFSERSGDYASTSTTSYDEFTIIMQDYLTLENSGTFKSYREQKEKERSSKGITLVEPDELDKLIAEKIAKLLSDNTKSSLVKKSTTVKKKKALV